MSLHVSAWNPSHEHPSRPHTRRTRIKLRALETKALLPLDEVARTILEVVGPDAKRERAAVGA